MIATTLTHNQDVGTLWLTYQGDKKVPLAKITREQNLCVDWVWRELNNVFGVWLRSRTTDLGTVKQWEDIELVGQNFVVYLNDLEILLQWTQR